MIVIEVDSELYNLDNRIKMEDLIRRILAEVDLGDNMERIYE